MKYEQNLINQAKCGDKSAQEELLRRYQNRLYTYLFRVLKNKHQAEDALQETFMLVLKNIAKYKEQGNFNAWIFRIAYRQALQIFRKRKRKLNNLEQIEPIIPKQTENIRDVIIRNEQYSNIKLAVAKLPDDEQTVVSLRIYAKLSFKEIANIMDCPINTALGRMRNALKRLKKELQNHGDIL